MVKSIGLRTVAEHTIDNIDIVPPHGALFEKPVIRPTFEEAKALKLAELNAAFIEASETAHCISSVGFEINTDETANQNISSLIISMEATGTGSVRFCAYDNSFHEVTLLQLKAMQFEIIDNAQAIRQMKWGLREQIKVAETVEALEAINITSSSFIVCLNAL